MTQLRLPIFVDCPWGGCEEGYCACLEQDLAPENFADPSDDSEGEPDEETQQMLDDLDAGRAVIYRGRFRPIQAVHLPAHEPVQGL